MERLIRRLLLGWLLLLGGVVLACHYGYSPLSHRLGWAVPISILVVGLLLLAHVVLGLRGVWHRVRVLRRARLWRHKRQAAGRWLDTQWEDIDA